MLNNRVCVCVCLNRITGDINQTLTFFSPHPTFLFTTLKTRTYTLSLSHAYTRSLSISHTHTLTHTHASPHTLSHTHTFDHAKYFFCAYR